MFVREEADPSTYVLMLFLSRFHDDIIGSSHSRENLEPTDHLYLNIDVDTFLETPQHRTPDCKKYLDVDLGVKDIRLSKLVLTIWKTFSPFHLGNGNASPRGFIELFVKSSMLLCYFMAIDILVYCVKDFFMRILHREVCQHSQLLLRV